MPDFLRHHELYPLPMEFFRQEYWSGLPFLSLGKLPNPGIKPGSPALQAYSLPSEPIRVFLGGSAVKASAWNAGDLGSIPGSGRFPWRRKWQPTPVLLPGESRGQRSLAGYSPCGLKESDTTEVTYHMHARDILCLLIWQETASVLAQSVKSPPAMQETQV